MALSLFDKARIAKPLFIKPPSFGALVNSESLRYGFTPNHRILPASIRQSRGSTIEPRVSPNIILRRAIANGVHQSEKIHRVGIPLLGQFEHFLKLTTIFLKLSAWRLNEITVMTGSEGKTQNNA